MPSLAPGLIRLAVLATFMGATNACHAAPEEIQVYLDDLRAPGQLGVDVHNNFVVSGRRAAEYAGEQPPAKVYRLTPEFAYGLSSMIELGFYALSTTDAGGNFHGDGLKARIKYIAPHDAQAGLFWGVNLEVGRSSQRVFREPLERPDQGHLGLPNRAVDGGCEHEC